LRTRELVFSPEVSGRLSRLAAEEGAPREAVFAGALVALLSRYSGGDKVSLAIRSRGRNDVARVDLEGDPDARALVRRAGTAMASAARIEGPPPKHRVAGTSDADVVFALDEDHATADVTLVVKAGALQLRCRAARFEESAVSRIAEHLRALVVGMASASGPVSAIPIVAGEERAWILARSNVSGVTLDEPLPTAVEWFEDHVRRSPAAIAVVDGDRELTYRQLDDAANALCDRLRARAVAAGDRVAVYLERGADAVVAFVAVLKARGTYVPIDTGYPSGRVEAVLESAAPRLVLTCASLAHRLPGATGEDGRPSLVLVDGPAPAAEGKGTTRPRVRSEDAAYAFFTSGSTGQPKGVVVGHRALANYVRAAFDAYRVRAEDRVLQAASLGFDLSLEEILVTLTAGATLVVRSAPPIESVQAFLAECVERRLTVLSITSALWHELTMRLADGSATLPPLVRLVILGADVARPDVLASWQRATAGSVRLVNSYGLTETTIVATVWEATREPLDGDWRAVPLGCPLRNVSAYVVDPKGDLAPVGTPGEICVGGLAVADGYLGDDALTAARFVVDPFLRGGRMYRTGDGGILRANGDLEFLGRADHRIKVGGVRIELGEIESRLREFPGVVEAVVVARTTQAGEIELEAHAMGSAAEVTPAGLRAHLASLLPPAVVPARLNVVERFPLTPAGKIDRRALAAVTVAVRSAEFVAPRSAVEKVVAETVAEVLGIAQVGVSDEFTSLGGSSLSAVRAASILQHRLGRRVPAHLLLESKSLKDVSEALEKSQEGTTEAAALARALERDAILNPDIAPRRLQAARAPLSTVFLTGATGYYGAFVLADLLRDTRAQVVCLVRAQTAAAGMARVVAALARRGCAVDRAVLASRVTIVCGDAERPHFGLTADAFRAWSESVDAVVHVAARVHMLLPYASLRASNVLAVESALRLATTGRPKSLHHVSTVEVLADADPRAPDALAERRTGSSPALLETGYGQSKWVAEKLVEAARDRGVRAFIHRPGRLMGHSSTGAYNEDDFLVQLLDACGRVGAAPILDVAVDITPVDYASRALVRLVETEPAGDAFHLVAPQAPAWSALLETILGLGYPLRAVPFTEWRSLVRAYLASDGRAGFLHYLSSLSREELEASIRGGFASSSSRAALGADLACPPVDAALVETYLGALARDGRFAIARTTGDESR
jgi:amino acid adenylation domain-containing protein/thioester reductase-like protein